MGVPNTFTDGTVAYGADVNENFTNIENYLGYTQITSTFNTTTTPTIVDVTNLTVTVTVPSGGRKIKITAYSPYMASSEAAGQDCLMYIREGSTTLTQTNFTVPVSNYSQSQIAIYVATATAGSHTYKVSVSQSGAGTLAFLAGTDHPAFILVEQI